MGDEWRRAPARARPTLRASARGKLQLAPSRATPASVKREIRPGSSLEERLGDGDGELSLRASPAYDGQQRDEPHAAGSAAASQVVASRCRQCRRRLVAAFTGVHRHAGATPGFLPAAAAPAAAGRAAAALASHAPLLRQLPDEPASRVPGGDGAPGQCGTWPPPRTRTSERIPQPAQQRGGGTRTRPGCWTPARRTPSGGFQPALELDAESHLARLHLGRTLQRPGARQRGAVLAYFARCIARKARAAAHDETTPPFLRWRPCRRRWISLDGGRRAYPRPRWPWWSNAMGGLHWCAWSRARGDLPGRRTGHDSLIRASGRNSLLPGLLSTSTSSSTAAHFPAGRIREPQLAQIRAELDTRRRSAFEPPFWAIPRLSRWRTARHARRATGLGCVLLYRHGQRYEDNCRRCPLTAQVLDGLPHPVSIAPEICFSPCSRRARTSRIPASPTSHRLPPAVDRAEDCAIAVGDAPPGAKAAVMFGRHLRARGLGTAAPRPVWYCSWTCGIPTTAAERDAITTLVGAVGDFNRLAGVGGLTLRPPARHAVPAAGRQRRHDPGRGGTFGWRACHRLALVMAWRWQRRHPTPVRQSQKLASFGVDARRVVHQTRIVHLQPGQRQHIAPVAQQRFCAADLADGGEVAGEGVGVLGEELRPDRQGVVGEARRHNDHARPREQRRAGRGFEPAQAERVLVHVPSRPAASSWRICMVHRRRLPVAAAVAGKRAERIELARDVFQEGRLVCRSIARWWREALQPPVGGAGIAVACRPRRRQPGHLESDRVVMRSARRVEVRVPGVAVPGPGGAREAVGMPVLTCCGLPSSPKSSASLPGRRPVPPAPRQVRSVRRRRPSSRRRSGSASVARQCASALADKPGIEIDAFAGGPGSVRAPENRPRAIQSCS